MSGILQNYLPLVVFIGVAGLIGLVLLIAPFIVATIVAGPIAGALLARYSPRTLIAGGLAAGPGKAVGV